MATEISATTLDVVLADAGMADVHVGYRSDVDVMRLTRDVRGVGIVSVNASLMRVADRSALWAMAQAACVELADRERVLRGRLMQWVRR